MCLCPALAEAIRNYQECIDVFAKVDDDDKRAEQTLQKIGSTKATGMLLNVLVPDKPITKVKRHKACTEVLKM